MKDPVWVCKQVGIHLEIGVEEVGSFQASTYTFTGMNAGRGSILFCHGIGNNGIFPQLPLLIQLAQEGFLVKSFDQAGHGIHSTTPLNSQLLLDLPRQLLNAMPTPRYIIGFSLGGSVALQLLLKDQAIARAGIIIASPHQIQFEAQHVLPEFFGFLSPKLWRNSRYFGYYGLLPAFGPFKRKTFPIRYASPPSHSFEYIDWVTNYINELKLLEKVPQISQPILFLYGEKDQLVPANQGIQYSQKTANATFKKVEANHLSITMDERATVEIEKWIKSLEN